MHGNSDQSVTYVFQSTIEQSTKGCFRAVQTSAAQYFNAVSKRSRRNGKWLREVFPTSAFAKYCFSSLVLERSSFS